jgi:DNA-binding NarL/FixJ family response regulator
MSDVHDLVLSPVLRAGVGTRRPKGPVLAVHTGGWEADRRTSAGEEAASAVRVYVYAKDAILRAGVASQLRRSAGVLLADEYRPDRAGVAIVVTDELGDDVDGAVRAVRRSCTPRIILVTNQLNRTGVDSAFEAGTWMFLRRGDARPDRLAEAVRQLAATVEAPGSVDHALGELADDVVEDGPPPEPPRVSGLTERDMEVLRLMADGHSTAGIARDLAYSESTIKNIIHAIVRELGARNRAHAVAMALRSQMI